MYGNENNNTGYLWQQKTNVDGSKEKEKPTKTPLYINTYVFSGEERLWITEQYKNLLN